MSFEHITIIRVIEDHHVIEPGGTLSIAFMPSEGPAVIRAHSSNAPDDIIVGGSPTELIPGAQDILDARTPVSPLSATATSMMASNGTEVSPGILPEATLAAQPNFGLGDEFLGGDFIGGVIPVDNIKMEILRPVTGPGPEQVELDEDIGGRGARILSIDNILPVVEGIAPESWTARFTNIANKPIQIFGSILFRESRKVEVHTLPKSLMQRLLNQTLEGLGLVLNLSGNQISLDFDHKVKELVNLEKITKKLKFEVFGDVSLSNLEIELIEARDANDNGPFPAIKMTISFEESGPEISLDLGTNIDINISNLDFTFVVILKTRQPALNPAGARGDHPMLKYIYSEIQVETDVKFSSRALGIVRETANAFLSAIDAVTGLITNKAQVKKRIPTLAEVVTAIGEEIANDFAFELSQYIQIGLNRIIDRDKLFHDLRLDGNNWEVLTGPFLKTVTPQPLNAPPVIPLANAEPIDGPQPPEELDALNRIDHFVVLMMENRSFDHVLGWHSHPSHGNDPSFEGLSGTEVNRITGLNDAIPVPMQTTKFFPSPPHGFNPVIEQIDSGRMSGFGNTFKQALESKVIAGDARSIMNFNTQGMLPVYDRFVTDYTVANHWYASHPGPTWPNRFCTLSGQTPILRNGDLSNDDLGYVESQTLFELLDEFNVNWRCYESDIAFLRMLKTYRLDSTRIRPYELFENEALAGLPPVTFIEPNFVDVPGGGLANDDHPGGADMINGQRLIAQIHNVLTQTPGWRNTMFIITYDEHGGFFDHVPPPGSLLAEPKGFDEVKKVHPEGPNMLGVRVPTFIISPRSEPGRIVTRVFDHTSIAKSIIARFLPGNEHRLSRRVETAAHLGGTVPLAQPRTDTNVFAVPNEIRSGNREIQEPFSFHDDMSSLGNPMRQSIDVLRTMLPKFRPE